MYFILSCILNTLVPQFGRGYDHHFLIFSMKEGWFI